MPKSALECLKFHSALLLLDIVMLWMNSFGIGAVVDLLPLDVSVSWYSCCGWSKFRIHINEHVQG